MAKNTEDVTKKKVEETLDNKVKDKTKKKVKDETKKIVEKEKKEKKGKTAKSKTAQKSVQNKAIENIKTFISKILDMQEKIKQDEQEEKKEKEIAKKEKKESDEKNSKYLTEYYDLPYRYNETVVKILAQTPKRLFVYWDVSDKDRITYLNAFGENFFEDTYPVLLLHNEDKDYVLEIAINDFANSWYLDVPDPRDKYTIQLGRKFKSHIKPPHIKQEVKENKETKINLSNDYLFIAISNKLEVPNNHILFEEFKPEVKYRDVKTMKEEEKIFHTTAFKNKLQNLYRELYSDEEIIDDTFDLLNPSSMGTSSSIVK